MQCIVHSAIMQAYIAETDDQTRYINTFILEKKNRVENDNDVDINIDNKYRNSGSRSVIYNRSSLIEPDLVFTTSYLVNPHYL
jgi:hypothetical protein